MIIYIYIYICVCVYIHIYVILVCDLTTDSSERVRVAVRLRPKNAEDLLPDSDFADCVELQPEVIMCHQKGFFFFFR